MNNDPSSLPGLNLENRFNIFDMLVRSHYDLNLQNYDGDTAAHIAAQRGNLRQLQSLVSNSADINMLNKHSLSPLYLAILNNHEDCVVLLIKSGAMVFHDGSDIEKDRSPVFLAIRKENQKILEAIFASVSNSDGEEDIKNSQMLTPVMFAAKHKFHKALNLLIELNSKSINEEDN